MEGTEQKFRQARKITEGPKERREVEKRENGKGKAR